VRLGGLFHTAWMASLCNRLAEVDISIDHMHARLAHESSWIAELHVVAREGGADPKAISFLELTDGSDLEPPNPLRLDTYRVIESRSFGGTLALSFEARDALGLLGSLLASLASLGLYPVEMHIETRADRVYDCLWLWTAEGAAPSADTRMALETLLGRWVGR
jgi:hypothetical protein